MFILHYGISSDLEKKINITFIMGPLQHLAMFFLFPSAECLASGLSLVVFSVPGIYVETYVYNDMYVCLLMTSYFRTSDPFFR